MKYYYPYITNPNDCLKCLECATSCPVQAIEYEEDWALNENKCNDNQNKIRDVCMICMEACRKKIIQLR